MQILPLIIESNIWYMARSILNVHSKSITSPIFLKFCGHLRLAIKWWHANFENDRITFRAFWADLRESLSVYPKSGKNSLNFSIVLVQSIIILQLFFSYQNKDLGLFYLMNFEVFQKKKIGGCTGCPIFLVILEWPSLGLNSKKHTTSDFHENW